MKKRLHQILAALLLAGASLAASAQTATAGEMKNTQAFMDNIGGIALQREKADERANRAKAVGQIARAPG